MSRTPIKNPAWIAIVLGLLISACATAPVTSRHGTSDDLADVVNDAIRISGSLGAHEIILVFDIDNTLIAMEQGLGADQWYDFQKELAQADPCHEYVVADRFAVQGAMYFASAMRPTQPDAADLVRRVQDAGIPAIALTSRGPVYRLQTFRELRRNGFDFRRSAIGPDRGWPEAFIPDRGIRPARYEDGVFMTSGQHKGVMLQELLERTGTKLPRVVLMVDDKQENLDDLVETFTGLGIPVRSWRYSREDPNVSAFDPDASHELWQTLLPAMKTIQQALGPDNFELPAHNLPAECLQSNNSND